MMLKSKASIDNTIRGKSREGRGSGVGGSSGGRLGGECCTAIASARLPRKSHWQTEEALVAKVLPHPQPCQAADRWLACYHRLPLLWCRALRLAWPSLLRASAPKRASFVESIIGRLVQFSRCGSTTSRFSRCSWHGRTQTRHGSRGLGFKFPARV